MIQLVTLPCQGFIIKFIKYRFIWFSEKWPVIAAKSLLPKILNKKTSLLKGNWYSGDLPSDDAEAKEDI